GTMIPRPARQTNRPDPLLDRLDRFEQRSHLRPSLPVVADIYHAILFWIGSHPRPAAGRLIGGVVVPVNCRQIKAVKQESAGFWAERTKRGLEDSPGHRGEAIDPFPPH